MNVEAEIFLAAYYIYYYYYFKFYINTVKNKHPSAQHARAFRLKLHYYSMPCSQLVSMGLTGPLHSLLSDMDTQQTESEESC